MKQLKDFLASDSGKALVSGVTVLYFIYSLYAQRQRVKLTELELKKIQEDV